MWVHYGLSVHNCVNVWLTASHVIVHFECVGKWVRFEENSSSYSLCSLLLALVMLQSRALDISNGYKCSVCLIPCDLKYMCVLWLYASLSHFHVPCPVLLTLRIFRNPFANSCSLKSCNRWKTKSPERRRSAKVANTVFAL